MPEPVWKFNPAVCPEESAGGTHNPKKCDFQPRSGVQENMNILGFEIKNGRSGSRRGNICTAFFREEQPRRRLWSSSKERLPREDKKAVMLYYILVKDAMTAGMA